MQKVLSYLVPHNYTLLYSKADVNSYKVEKLYHKNNIAYIPFNLIDDKMIYGIQDVFMRKDILIDLRNQIINKADSLHDIDYPQNIYLRRKKYRIADNENHFIEYFKKYNFQEVFFEDLKLTEQIKYFYNAECIIGVTGAAWANLLFAKPSLKSICFMQDNLPTFSCYSNLANIFNVEMVYYLYKVDHSISEHYKDGYILDEIKIENIYKKLQNGKTRNN